MLCAHLREASPLRSKNSRSISSRRVFISPRLWFAGLGAAMINTVYKLVGLKTFCHIGGEIRNPEKNIPRGIFISFRSWHHRAVISPCRPAFSRRPWRKPRHSLHRRLFVELLLRHRAAKLRQPGWFSGSPWPPFFAFCSAIPRCPIRSSHGNFSPVCQKRIDENFPHIALLITPARWRSSSEYTETGDRHRRAFPRQAPDREFIGQAGWRMLLRRASDRRTLAV